ncbi:MAG: LysM peptidoglycan-binding domain-containing protein [Phototrophicaceae bacterium]
MQRSFFTVTTTCIALLLSVAITMAQGVCDQFVGRALEAVDGSCNTLGRNQACYGFTRVEASFQSDMGDDFFTNPADVADVAELETIRTAPLNVATDEWGVAVLVLQANMPETLPGQNVTFILMGDAELENAVASDDAYDPITGIDVTVTFPQGAAVRSGPGDNFNTLGGVTVGTIFNTDGISADGNWLRIVWEERPAWIRRTTVDPIEALATLPTLDENLRTPMQSFYLRTGIGEPSCNEVPDDALLIQGPDNIEIDLTVNGANIALGSSGILRIIDDGSGTPQLEITVLDGEFVVKADNFNPQDVIIRAGQRSTLCLADGNNIGVDGVANDLVVTCAASPPETINFETFRDDWCKLENVPSGLLNYDLSTCTINTHTIQSGENLFRIAQFYCVDLADLVALNSITDPTQIFVGQILTLPPDVCDGTGSTRPPATVINTDAAPTDNTNTNACSVALIYPIQDVNSGTHTFQWTPVAGAGISYELVFFTFEDIQAEVFYSDTPSYTLNLGQQTSTGGEFSWAVNVYQDDGVICSARSPRLIRTGDLNPAPPSDTNFTLGLNCVISSLAGVINATVSWSNLPAGQSVSVTLDDGFTTASGGPFIETNASKIVSIPFYYPAIATATSTTGDNISVTCT